MCPVAKKRFSDHHYKVGCHFDYTVTFILSAARAAVGRSSEPSLELTGAGVLIYRPQILCDFFVTQTVPDQFTAVGRIN